MDYGGGRSGKRGWICAAGFGTGDFLVGLAGSEVCDGGCIFVWESELE